MTKKEIRQKYCDKRNYTSWNKYNITEYSKWLENELIKAQKQVKKLNIPVVVKSFYCYDKTVANAEEDYDFKQCDEQCEKCKQ